MKKIFLKFICFLFMFKFVLPMKNGQNFDPMLSSRKLEFKTRVEKILSCLQSLNDEEFKKKVENLKVIIISIDDLFLDLDPDGEKTLSFKQFEAKIEEKLIEFEEKINNIQEEWEEIQLEVKKRTKGKKCLLM
ncbi:hypothetical protein KAT08_00650 [Candidatus Babeliales bacterium]|nr:hypothetical protein [Candidatus Babeliales bacterium]